MTLYIYFAMMIWQTKVDNFCESQFYAPKSDAVVRLCEKEVWRKSFPWVYNK